MNGIIEEHRNEESGELHRIGGPARVYSNGNMFWYRHGKYHRRGGPAAIFSGGGRFWYVNDHGLQAPDRLPERAHPIMELFL